MGDAEPPGFGAMLAPCYIAVEGPIGAGKSTLARRLAATLGSRLLLEAPEDNPFLADFYRDARSNALPAQLHFLLQRARQARRLREDDPLGRGWVSDFMPEKDRLFARATLGDEDYALYERLYARLLAASRRPDLVIYLQAPAAVLRARVARRGNGYERGIDEAYLERIATAYGRFFGAYREAPLLAVDTAQINLVDGDGDYNFLLERLLRLQQGRGEAASTPRSRVHRRGDPP